ncbi:MAG: hypothetical protein WCF26_06970 [Candidatus Sulfotelmatobacter sp.]
MKNKQPTKIEPQQFLSGWKDIANYLGKGVRTVQRYERYMGLPVRRPAGKDWGSVVATKAELDAWVMASPIREAFHLSTQTQMLQQADAREVFRAGLAEMGKLRDQLLALRAEVTSSVQLLKESVNCLQGELNQNRWPASPNQTLLDGDLNEKIILDFAAALPRFRKVS